MPKLKILVLNEFRTCLNAPSGLAHFTPQQLLLFQYLQCVSGNTIARMMRMRRILMMMAIKQAFEPPLSSSSYGFLSMTVLRATLTPNRLIAQTA